MNIHYLNNNLPSLYDGLTCVKMSTDIGNYIQHTAIQTVISDHISLS